VIRVGDDSARQDCGHRILTDVSYLEPRSLLKTWARSFKDFAVALPCSTRMAEQRVSGPEPDVIVLQLRSPEPKGGLIHFLMLDLFPHSPSASSVTRTP
jgi:hypothetical protein